MKTMIILALCSMAIFAEAQTNIEKTLSFQGKKSIKMDIQIADSIEITTWNRNEIGVKAMINLNDNNDNEAYLTSFDQTGDQVLIKANIKEDYFKKNDCCCKGMITWKIAIPEGIPFIVETINGNILIKGRTTEIEAKTISGFIDVSIPDGRKANLEMSTISGTLYSNLDLNEVSGNNFPQKVNQKLNGGGLPLQLETISGDIFCRLE